MLARASEYLTKFQTNEELKFLGAHLYILEALNKTDQIKIGNDLDVREFIHKYLERLKKNRYQKIY